MGGNIHYISILIRLTLQVLHGKTGGRVSVERPYCSDRMLE